MSALWTAVRFIYCSLLWGVFGCVHFCQLMPVSLFVKMYVFVYFNVRSGAKCMHECEMYVCACVSGMCLCGRHTFLPTATVCWLSRDLWISQCYCCSSVVLIVLL